MTQGTPNAPVEGRRTSSGYAGTFDGKVAIWSGLEFGGNAFVEPGDGNNSTTDIDTAFVLADTSASTSTITLANESAVQGRVITVVDKGANAGNNAITIDTAGSQTIDGSASTTISTNSSQVRLINDGTDWFTW